MISEKTVVCDTCKKATEMRVADIVGEVGTGYRCRLCVMREAIERNEERSRAWRREQMHRANATLYFQLGFLILMLLMGLLTRC